MNKDIQSTWILPPNDEINFREEMSNNLRDKIQSTPVEDTIDPIVGCCEEDQSHIEQQHTDVSNEDNIDNIDNIDNVDSILKTNHPILEDENTTGNFKNDEKIKEKGSNGKNNPFAIAAFFMAVAAFLLAADNHLQQPPLKTSSMKDSPQMNSLALKLSPQISDNQTKINELNTKLKKSLGNISLLEQKNTQILKELDEFKKLASENTANIKSFSEKRKITTPENNDIITAQHTVNKSKNTLLIQKNVLINQVTKGIDNVLTELN